MGSEGSPWAAVAWPQGSVGIEPAWKSQYILFSESGEGPGLMAAVFTIV